MIDKKSPDEPTQTTEEHAKEGAFLAADWVRIALVAIIGTLLLALLLLYATGQI